MDIRGVEGLSIDEVRMRVNQGGKFVMFTWTLSFVVMTVRRPTAVYFINPGESAALKGMPFTLVSFFLGWWGIPWGFIYTPMSIFENLGGGKDVTNEVMQTLGGGSWQAAQLAAPGADPGSAFREGPGTMSPAPRLSEQAGIDNDARLSMYLGLGSLLCIPSGWFSIFLGIRAIGRARGFQMSPPGQAIVGIVLSSCTTLCIGGFMVLGAVLPDPKTRDEVSVTPMKTAAAAEEPAEEDTAAPPPTKDEGTVVQPGGSRGPHLGFRIVKLHEQQKPSKKPPYFEPGGDWTFMELDAGEGVALVAGIQFKKSSESFSFGKAQLSVANPEAGAAFTSAFDAQFGGKAGKLKAHKGPLEMGVAVLGQDLVRERHGGFRGGRFGKWTATKLFPELDGRQGEVFFNYSVEDKTAELTEKDADYADDLAFVFGSAFKGR